MTEAIDPLAPVYDAATLGRIDPPARRVVTTGPSWRALPLAGAIAGRALAGVAEALEVDEAADHVGEVRPEPLDDPTAAVVVHFVPHDPAATVAVIRPWLLASAGSGAGDLT